MDATLNAVNFVTVGGQWKRGVFGRRLCWRAFRFLLAVGLQHTNPDTAIGAAGFLRTARRADRPEFLAGPSKTYTIFSAYREIVLACGGCDRGL